MKKTFQHLLLLSVFLFLNQILISCSSGDSLKSPEIILEIPNGGFSVVIDQTITISPEFTFSEEATCKWSIDNKSYSTARQLVFTPEKVGKYACTVQVITPDGEASKSFDIVVTTPYSPYITKVFEYVYGVGQHASLIPADSKASDFIGKPWENNKSFTYLGGWGGYIVAGFDHAVRNREGTDLCIYVQPGSASEPGVIFVMQDSNNDGQPNDRWYEIKGSEYSHPETIRHYQVTYNKPLNGGNVTWSDNQGNSGELKPNFQSESWWWSGYRTSNAITFTGVKLPNAYYDNSTTAGTENWVVKSGLFQTGYAECYNNSDYNSTIKANLVDISNAVDDNGTAVALTSIHFIKVQSAVFQIAGWLNEISTEISGASDLHLLDKDIY